MYVEECLFYELWNVSQGNSRLDVCFASLNTLPWLRCMLELPVRSPAGLFKYVICTGKTLTSLWYNLSQGKLHSLVTLMQRLWSSDTGSTSSAFLDSEDWIVLPEGSQMVSLFCFCLSLSLSLPASPPHNVHLNIWQLTHDTRTYSCSFTTSW